MNIKKNYNKYSIFIILLIENNDYKIIYFIK